MVRGSALAGVTVAMSASRICRPVGPIGISRISIGSRSSVSARTEKRNCPRLIVPPCAVALALSIAVLMSSGVRPRARARSGSTSTRISSFGSPTTATLATPESCSRRRLWTSIAVRAIARRSPGPGEADHRDRSLARISGEQRRALRGGGELVAGVVESLAHGEHRARHVGAPIEAERGRRLAAAGDRAHLEQARACCRPGSRSVPR